MKKLSINIVDIVVFTVVACFAASFLFCSASRAEASSLAELAPVFDKYEIGISDNDLSVIHEVYEYWAKRGDTIWPGVDFQTTPIAIVFPEKYNILIGHDRDITGEIFLTDKFPLFNKKAVLIKDNTFMHGAMTSPAFNGRPTVFINTIETTNKFTRDYAKSNNLKEYLNYKINLLEYMGKITHELFHAYQYGEMKLYPRDGKPNKPIRLTKIDYPYLDGEIDMLLGVEGKILAKIFASGDTAEIDSLWNDFLCVRKFRHAKIDPELVRLEDYMEFSEGTAQYVECMVRYAATNEAGIFDDIRKLPGFGETRTNDSFKDFAAATLNKLYSPQMNMYMTYVYFTGMAQTYTLNKIRPDWRKDLFRKHRNFGKIAFENAAVSTDEAKIKELKAKYGADEMAAKINEELGKLKEVNRKKFDKFSSAAGMKFDIVFEGACAKDVLVYAPVLLTEHENIRIFEAGCSKIERIDDEFDALATIDFKAAVPIFFDRNSGEVSFIIEKPEKQKFEITSKTKKEDRNKTVYENEAAFTNEVFGFTAAKIEVIKISGDHVKIIVK